MIVAVGCDHGGFELKRRVIEETEGRGHLVLDVGAFAFDPQDDYPAFARLVGAAIADARAERGILVCGSGVGVSVAASKVIGVRAALCHDTYSARQGVERGAGAPLTRQKSARLAGCCRGDLGPLDDDDVDPAATKEVGRARADYASAADHNPHVLPNGFQPSTSRSFSHSP